MHRTRNKNSPIHKIQFLGKQQWFWTICSSQTEGTHWGSFTTSS
jgi:hypothetical protein